MGTTGGPARVVGARTVSLVEGISKGGGALDVPVPGATVGTVGATVRVGALVSVVRLPSAPHTAGTTYWLDVPPATFTELVACKTIGPPVGITGGTLCVVVVVVVDGEVGDDGSDELPSPPAPPAVLPGSPGAIGETTSS